MKKNKTDLTKDIIEQFQLPSYVAKKTFADASKAIDNKFKDRKDMHSQETKEELLERLANAQEYIKMQQQAEEMANMPPEMQQQMMGQQDAMGQNPSQEMMAQQGGMPDLGQMLGQRMDLGGYTNGRQPVQAVNGLTPQGPSFQSGVPTADTSGLVEQTGGALGASVGGNAGAAIGGATQLVGLGVDAFKDSGIDTSGKMGRMDNVNVGAETGKAALKGAAAGAALGSVIPGVGTVIGGAAGAVIGGASGFIKGKKGRADSIQANTNALYAENNMYDNNFSTGRVAAKGGYIDSGCGGPGQPPCNEKLTKDVNDATGLNFDSSTANRLFEYEPVNPNVKSKNKLNLGSYDNRNYFNIKDQQENIVITPSDSNPQNAYGYKSQIDYLKKLNPDIIIDGQYVQNTNRRPLRTGGYADDPYNPNIDPVPDLLFPQANDPLRSNSVNMISEDVSGVNFKQPIDFSGIAKWGKQNYGEVMRMAPAIGGLFNKIEKPVTEKGSRISNVYNRERMDEQSMVNAINQNNISGALSESSGGDIGALRANLLGAHSNKMKAISQAYQGKKAFDAQQNQMAHQYQTNANQFNAQMDERYIDRKARDEGAYNTAKQLQRQGVLKNIASVGRELSDKKNVAKMFGYKWNGEYWVNNKGEKMDDNQLISSLKGTSTKNKS